ncbi:MAG: mannitol dehydrogenase family protein [Lachnospiraceae bacterium]|nr:mannitol dehydrogenase family protein [Lachnospiraceae bacterium]
MALKLKTYRDNPGEWKEKGYRLPAFDPDAVKAVTGAHPKWIHFGAGNIFRAFPAAVLQEALDAGETDTGVIVAEGFDYEIIDRAYRPYDNLSLLVVLKADGSIEKRVIASVTESVCADALNEAEWGRLEEIFTDPSLQMVSFTITEKGYAVTGPDGSLSGIVQKDFADGGFQPAHSMGKIAALLYKRYESGAAPVAMVSMDNCSHNGDKLRDGVMAYVSHWCDAGMTPEGFRDYVSDRARVSFPWSMIDKITPRPDEKVQKMLEEDGFADTELIVTKNRSFTAPFVNAEEMQYLVIEDAFPNGRPPLEKGGVIFTDRDTVDRIEKMKVCTCLNPLHTALAIYGCLLGFGTIHEEMKDKALRTFITRMGNREGMPVVVNPGIIRPQDFLDEVLQKRLPNPFMPDTPQRIATDTSQKLPVRFGETLKAYREKGLSYDDLTYIPLVIAGYARYLMGVDDRGEPFTPSDDPLLKELSLTVKDVRLGAPPAKDVLNPLLTRKDLFGVDLYEAGMAEKIGMYFTELTAGKGAVRATLDKYTA